MKYSLLNKKKCNHLLNSVIKGHRRQSFFLVGSLAGPRLLEVGPEYGVDVLDDLPPHLERASLLGRGRYEVHGHGLLVDPIYHMRGRGSGLVDHQEVYSGLVMAHLGVGVHEPRVRGVPEEDVVGAQDYADEGHRGHVGHHRDYADDLLGLAVLVERVLLGLLRGTHVRSVVRHHGYYLFFFLSFLTWIESFVLEIVNRNIL